MGYEKQPNRVSDQDSKFLNLVYSDLDNVLNRFDKVHPFQRKVMLRDLAGVVVKRMKQSFKNGIEIGMKRGKRQKQENQEEN